MSSIPGSSSGIAQASQQAQQARLNQAESSRTDPTFVSQSGAVAVAASGTVGSGVIGGRNVTTSSTSGSISTATSSATGTAASFGLPAPRGSGEDLVLDLLRLQSAVQNNELQSSTSDVQTTRSQLADAAKQRLEQLNEQLKKLAEASNSSSIAKIFGWIGAALSLVIGAVLVATGVGVAAGAALIAVGVATIAIMAVQETIGFEKVFALAAESLQSSLAAIGIDISAEDARLAMTVLLAAAVLVVGVALGALNPAAGVGLFAALIGPILSPQNLVASGLDEEAAPWVALALQGAIAIIAIGVGIGSGVSQAANVSGNVANAGAQAADTVARTAPAIQRTAQAVQFAAQMGQGAAQMGQAGANIAASVQRFDAAGAEARSKEFLADIFLLQQEFQQQGDRLRETLQEIEQTNSVVTSILSNFDRVARRLASV